MEIYQADFVSSFTRESACPPVTSGVPEFAFIGRSNVGKSSLINMLTNRKGLAKVSGTPGKTQLLNFFLINKKWYLVDLPGYGYARVSKSKQKELAAMINGYLFNRQTLMVAFVLVDSNIPPTKIDIDFINTLGDKGVPIVILFTKSDRMKPGALQRNVQEFLDELSESWDELPPHFITSAEYRTGREEILSYIATVLKS